jgi:thiamine-phosphate pyrophosphorylase
MHLQSPFLYPILDDVRSSDLVRDAQDVIRAGAIILQLRAKRLSNKKLFQITSEILAKNSEITLIINDRVDICLVTDAAGVHLGQNDFPVPDARNLLPHSIIGISTHNIHQFQLAMDYPVDYISIGPIFPTSSKLNPDPVVGISLLKQAKEITNKPLVCIGGIQAKDIPDLIKNGANGIAVISELYLGSDIYGNTKRMLEIVHTNS